MIFVTVGSQKFQFNRLLEKIDKLIEDGVIKEEVYAQIGVSDYTPQNYEYEDFMTQEEFNEKIQESDLVITHAGTGVIINSLKRNKKVIGIPRLVQYNEHVDDHQIQLIKEFVELNFIEAVFDIKDLDKAIKEIKNKNFSKYESNTDNLLGDIRKFLEEEN